MHHCVGGYIDRHARGETIIVFVRDPMYPLIPRWTVEISPDGKLIQVQGYNNRQENKPSGEAKAFLDRWLTVVQARHRQWARQAVQAKEEA